MNPVIIMVAPNGARRGKVDHPAIPLSLDEIIAEAGACHRAGAAMLHLHVRDANGQHSIDPAAYKEALAGLGEHVPGMLVQITTEAAGRFEPHEQEHCLEAVCPDFASVSVREIARDPKVAGRLYHFAREAGISLQHILYDVDDLAQLSEWRRTGIVPDGPASLLFVLGRYAEDGVGDVRQLLPFVQNYAPSDIWSVCAFGANEAAACGAAIALGGHVRVGFENNFCLPNGDRAASNAELVANIVQAARHLGRPLAESGDVPRIVESTLFPKRAGFKEVYP